MRVLLIAYDNDDYIGHLPLGLGYLASNVNVRVDIWHQDIYHWPDEALTEYLDHNTYDVVGVGMCGGYYQYRRLLSISKAVNASKNRSDFKYILGGKIVSPEPEYFLQKCSADGAVVGEGEAAFQEYLNNPQRIIDLPPIEGVDSIKWPAYDKFPMNHYGLLRRPHATNADRVIPMMSGRGCPFKCNFCYRADPGFRPRDAKDISAEVAHVSSFFGINYIFFADDLLMSSKQRVFDVCDQLDGLGVKWCCSGRLNYASVEVLERMKSAGCVFINYGIESLDAIALKMMNKALNPEQIITGIENTLKVGISPGLNIIWGNIGETLETLQKGVEFLLKYDDGAQIRTIKPVTPYPGCDLYHKAIKEGRLDGIEDFYENKHQNSDRLAVNFTDLSDDAFHAALFDANKKLLKNYYDHQAGYAIDEMKGLYLENAPFRGFRRS